MVIFASDCAVRRLAYLVLCRFRSCRIVSWCFETVYLLLLYIIVQAL